MIKPFGVEIPIFRMHLVVCGDCTADEAVEAFYKFKGKCSKVDARQADGWVQHYMGDVFMWVKDPKGQASIVFHELVHVAFSICEIKGMHPDEELIAYLVGWLKIHVADKIFEKAGA